MGSGIAAQVANAGVNVTLLVWHHKKDLEIK